MKEPGSERRRTRRSLAGGVVEITTDSGSPFSFEGELLDLSAGGFRIAHTQPGLEHGAEVRFQHPDAKGKARVVWNRLHAGRAESGFLVIE